MKEIEKLLIQYGITPNQYYLLWSIMEGTSSVLTNTFPDKRALKNKGFLVDDNTLSKEAKSIVEELEALFKKRRKKTNKAIMGDNFENELIKFNEIFPNIKLDTGRKARSTISNVRQPMRWFFENHDYSWEEIHAGAQAYVLDRELNNNKFFTCSQYFPRKVISGMPVSLLAEWCEIAKDNLDQSSESHFKDKVF